MLKRRDGLTREIGLAAVIGNMIRLGETVGDFTRKGCVVNGE